MQRPPLPPSRVKPDYEPVYRARTIPTILAGQVAQEVVLGESAYEWTAAHVDVDAQGDTSLNGAVVKVYAVTSAGETLIAQGAVPTPAPAGATRVVEVTGHVADRFKFTITTPTTLSGSPSKQVAAQMTCFDATAQTIPTNLLTVPTGTGFVHITAGVEDGAAKLVVDADVSALASIQGSKINGATAGSVGVVQLAGDLTGTSTAPTVGSLTGVAGTLAIAATAALMQWASTAVAPTLNQAQAAPSTAGQTMLIAAQQGGAGVAGRGGNLQLASGASGGGGDGTVQIIVGATTVAQFTHASSDFVALGATPSAAGFVRATQAASGTTNIASCKNTASADVCWAGFWHANASDDRFQLGPSSDTLGAASIVFQQQSVMLLQVSNQVAVANLSGQSGIVLVPAPAGAASISFSAGCTSATILQTTNATGNGATMLVHAQDSGGGNGNGGQLSLRGGLPNGTGNNGLVALLSPVDEGLLRYTFPADANQTLSVAQSANNILDIQAGVITAARTITVSRAANPFGQLWVKNRTAFAVTIVALTGTGIAVAPGASALLASDNTNLISET